MDAVVEATHGLDVSILYATTVRPFDRDSIAAAASQNVILVEPYLDGTSSQDVSAALLDRPHRLLSIGVPNVEHRHYGTPSDHEAAHGLDANGLRSRINAFLAGG